MWVNNYFAGGQVIQECGLIITLLAVSGYPGMWINNYFAGGQWLSRNVG